MKKIISRSFLFLLIVFIFPALANLGIWSFKERPSGWRAAKWASAGVLPKSPRLAESTIYVLSARTGGLKGAFATHSWLVLKNPGVSTYDRYDVVGWGKPVRKNAYDADGFWYSNKPRVIYSIEGKSAALLIPKIEAAIAKYKWSRPGDYTLWPGPNSNTFVATIIRDVPGFSAGTPSTAVGRDFPADGRWIGYRRDGALFATLNGYAGFVIGKTQGLELNFLGLVAGVNPYKGAIKIPAFGTYRW